MKRLNEIYIPTYVDVTELEEEVFDNHVELSVKDITSTKFVKKGPEPQTTSLIKKGKDFFVFQAFFLKFLKIFSIF